MYSSLPTPGIFTSGRGMRALFSVCLTRGPLLRIPTGPHSSQILRLFPLQIRKIMVEYGQIVVVFP